MAVDDTQPDGSLSRLSPFSSNSSLLHSLLQSLPLNVYAKDREGCFLFANNCYCRSVGKTLQEILGKTDHDLHPVELAGKYLEDDRFIMESGEITSFEEKWQTIGGSDRYVRVMKSPLYDSPGEKQLIGTIGIFWDITERKQTEITLAEERNLLRVLIDNLPDYIYVKDTKSRIILANKAQIAILGCTSQQEALGKTDLDFYPEAEARKYLDDEQQVFSTGKALIDEEEGVRDKNGRERWTLTTKIPFYNTEKNLIGLVGIGHDITRRKKEERERLFLETQLQQARKLETVGTLTSGIAHDFNNLLSVINGYTELLQISTASDHPHQNILTQMLQAGRSMADLVSQLLAFSRKQRSLPKIVNINTIIADLQQVIHQTIGEHIEISFNLKDDLCPVKFDPSQLEKIILNLLTNARDAMPSGGTLTLATEEVIVDEQYARQQTDMPLGRYTLLTVADNGTGISKEIQDHVFEPFYTTKEKQRGTGLGLATVFGIVKQNRGHIWLSSQEGLGTTIKIFLPSVPMDSTGGDEETIIADSEACTGNETVLVVEDDSSLQELARTILEQHGHSVITATNGQEAIAATDSLGRPLSLLLTNMVLPGISGRALADLLGKKYPALKILYISDYTDDTTAHQGILGPGIEIIHKPFSPAALTGKIRSLLDRSS